jgi:hypothetical protein
MVVIESTSASNGKTKYWITCKERESWLPDKEHDGKKSVQIGKDRLTWHSINLYKEEAFNLGEVCPVSLFPTWWMW